MACVIDLWASCPEHLTVHHEQVTSVINEEEWF